MVKSRQRRNARSQFELVRKPKFQADLVPLEDHTVRSLKAELQIASNSDFLSEAIALFNWAVSERKMGNRIMSVSLVGERKILVLPRLERIAPDAPLPHVKIEWTEKELESLARLVNSEPAKPAQALVKAMRG